MYNSVLELDEEEVEIVVKEIVVDIWLIRRDRGESG